MSDIRLDDLVEPSKEKSTLIKYSHFPYVGLEHLDSSVNEIRRCGESSNSISINNIFRYGDTLFGKLRPNLRKAAFAKFEGYCSTDILVLKSKENIDSLYASYICQSETVFGYAEKTAIGTGMPRTSWKEISKIIVYCPAPLSSQNKIARILSTTDAIIEKTQAAIAKYKAIKQGMLNDLFTCGINPATNKLRPAYQDGPHLYKQSKLGLIPREWKVEQVKNVSSLITNGFVGIATPYYTTSDKGVPYLFGTNIREDYIDFNNLRYISKKFHSNHIKSQLKNGDMLCVQSGHIGTCAVIPDNFGEANCHALIITRFRKNEIFPDFISAYINSSIGKHELDKIIIGSTVKHINTSDLANHLIPKPSLKEQIKISKRIKFINNKIKIEQAYLHKIQQIKTGLMADLLSGKKEVTVEAEPIN